MMDRLQMTISYLCLLHVFMLAFHACDVIDLHDFVHNMPMRKKRTFFVTPYTWTSNWIVIDIYI